MASNAATGKLASYISRLSPVPAFPAYTGPHKVGTVDVEIPVSELDAPSPAPAGAAAETLHTVQFRIFYPATPDTKGKNISWLPAPQRNHVSAYTKFLGIGPILSEVVSFLPRHLHYTTIPVHKNATLLEPPPECEDGRWPTAVFSHGLGGNRNAYSHIAGSLASHGVVVICLEHRDGSSAVSFVRDPASQDRFFYRNRRTMVPYNRIPHTEAPEVWEARDDQLRIRLWELGLVHEAILGIDSTPEGARRLSNLNTSTPTAALDQFRSRMQVHKPGSIVWAGHSFGAATMVQFLKSTYYADVPDVAAMAHPLFTPRPDSRLRQQVTERNLTILLDMWCFPLVSPSATVLHDLPLPVYADVPSAPGGHSLLAVESETFFKWKQHLHAKALILSPDPSAPVVTPNSFDRPMTGVRHAEPHFFYVQNSAHLSQSDFGILFPWLTRRVFGAEAPERALRLNVRAMLQLLRSNGVPVARTWVGDLVDGAHVEKMAVLAGTAAAAAATAENQDAVAAAAAAVVPDGSPQDGIHDDRAIFDRRGTGPVEAWYWVDIIGLGAEARRKAESVKGDDDSVANTLDGQGMAGEIEPQLCAVEGAGIMSEAVQAVKAAASAAAA